jgi:D-3-phosphoglycerate dehydrogenase
VFRTAYLHTSTPGVLADINRLLADAGVNVVGQSLSTGGDLGYVLTDTDQVLPEDVLSALRRAAQTVWLRSYRL